MTKDDEINFRVIRCDDRMPIEAIVRPKPQSKRKPYSRNREAERQWRAANRDLVKDIHRRCLDTRIVFVVDGIEYTLTRDRIHKLRRMYRLSHLDYVTLFRKNQGCCHLCDKPMDFGSAHVDHCHKTMVVRGLLCQRCNLRVGYFERIDLPRFLRYLSRED